MIVYVTKPDNHEVVMGGWRSVKVWTDKPDFHHWPVSGYIPMRGADQSAVYTDRGWVYKGDRQSNCRFKPLAEQNTELEENAWKLVVWSCIPKSANVALADTFIWANTLLAGEDPNDEFCKTNYVNLLWHFSGDTDMHANVHHKRFLMAVNLLTAECELIVPTVHFFDGNLTVQTADIEEPYASRTNYACDNDVPF